MTFAQKAFNRPAVSNGAGISQHSLGKPPASFPGSIANDAKLAIAVDRLQTTLAGSLVIGATSMTVADASKIVPWTLLSIDNEIVQVTGAPQAGGVVPISRGFDGTAQALHLSGATISGLIDAYHHNTLVAEIEAIEQTVFGLTQNWVWSSDYNFAAQTPGGSLSVGNNVITLNPMPRGMANGNYLYISGGTGTAESAQITGVGANTVIVNCAHTHSGAWTIQSSTAGISEAIGAHPNGVHVVVPAGTYAVDHVMITQSVWLQGMGENITTLTSLTGAGPALIQVNPAVMTIGIQVSDLTINLDGGPGTGLIGLSIDYSSRGNYRRLWIQGGAFGVKIATTNQVAWCHFADLTILHPSNTGFWCGDQGEENWWDDIDIQQDTTSPMQCGFQVVRTTATDTGVLYMKRVRSTRVASGTLTNGFLATCTASQPAVLNAHLVDCAFDANTGDAVKLVNCAEFCAVMCWFASSGSDSVGSAINLSNGFNFKFVQSKLASQNSSVVTYSNQPTNISFFQTMYLQVGTVVHQIPATGGPLSLQFLFDGGIQTNWTAFTNNWALLNNASGQLANTCIGLNIAQSSSGHLTLWDGAANNQMHIIFTNGILEFMDNNFIPKFKYNFATGNFILTLPTVNPGAGGGLYADPVTSAVYQGH